MDEFEQWQEKRIRKKMKNFNQDQFSDAKQTEVRCIGGKDKILLNPIIEWSEEDVWEFLNKVVEVPHCELYDEGYTRIGCIGCPMATTKNQIKQFKRWPHVKEKWIRAIMDVRRDSILANTPRIRKPIHENGNVATTIRTVRSAIARQDICEESRFGGARPLKGLWTGNFLDSGNGDCTAVTAEYDEQKEREIAEAIFDWWISKNHSSNGLRKNTSKARLISTKMKITNNK